MPQAIVLEKIDGEPGRFYYPLKSIDIPTPTPKGDELLVRMSAAALNHRDLFLRQHLYPGLAFGVPICADGVGIVVGAGSATLDAQWKGKRVILTPSRGWDNSPEGPDGPSGQVMILGGTRFHPLGTLQEIVCVEAAEVELAPDHLSTHEAAALPLTGLTAWRAFFTKSGNALPGHNILITGIGGGVALNALQFAVAAGCNVYVTSGSEEKIARAREMGALGGVNYHNEGWENKLVQMLPDQRRWLDAVIDGAGGDIAVNTTKILKVGGVIVSYGMTLGPSVTIPIHAVLKNIEFRGSTMGSRAEFRAMLEYVRTKEIRPVVSRVVRGLDLGEIDGLFDDMKTGKQFGKLVVEIAGEGEEGSKL